MSKNSIPTNHLSRHSSRVGASVIDHGTKLSYSSRLLFLLKPTRHLAAFFIELESLEVEQSIIKMFYSSFDLKNQRQSLTLSKSPAHNKNMKQFFILVSKSSNGAVWRFRKVEPSKQLFTKNSPLLGINWNWKTTPCQFVRTGCNGRVIFFVSFYQRKKLQRAIRSSILSGRPPLPIIDKSTLPAYGSKYENISVVCPINWRRASIDERCKQISVRWITEMTDGIKVDQVTLNAW